MGGGAPLFPSTPTTFNRLPVGGLEPTIAMTSLQLRRPPLRVRPLGVLATAVGLVAVTAIASFTGSGSGSPSRAALGGSPADAPVASAAPVAIPGTAGVQPAIGSVAQLDHNIAAWTANLRANPKDFISATNLASLYAGRARLTGDVDDYQRGLEAARQAVAIAPTQPAARSLEAALLFSLHDFRAARDTADAIVRADPAQLGALATRADAEIELGDLEAASDDLDALAAATSGPAVLVRQARLASARGDLTGALRLAVAARDAALSGDVEASFYQYAVGEYARAAGDAWTASAGFAAALAVRPNDLAALLGSARMAAWMGDLDAAIATLERATAIAPTPEAEALLGDLLTLRAEPGDDRAAAAAYGTVRLTRQLSELAGSVFDRQLLGFELDHGGDAAQVAAAALAALADRDDAPGHDLLAWALYRAGDIPAAKAESDLARSAGAADARTLWHAGAIAAALGDTAQARSLIASALALGPALDPAPRAEAAALLATLGSGG